MKRFACMLLITYVFCGCESKTSSDSDQVDAPVDSCPDCSAIDARDTNPDTSDDSGSDAAADLDSDSDVLWTEGNCEHPKVEKNCRDGWCSIPSGCFIKGAPPEEYGTGPIESQVQITLTRPFQIQQHPFTYGEWTALGLDLPDVDSGYECRNQMCPLAYVNNFEAWLLANLVSERHIPPLPPCYELNGCTGEMGEGVICKSVKLTAPTLYECQGFRLPSEYEWEYAARSGTKTPFYSGNFAPDTTPAKAATCNVEEALESIAWYCANSGEKTHEVGTKIFNQWGLHDVIGNVLEITNDPVRSARPQDPLEDPGGSLVDYRFRTARGGDFNSWATILRVAFGLTVPVDARGVGVRLVRTGTENPGPLPTSTTNADKATKAKPKPAPTGKPKQ